MIRTEASLKEALQKTPVLREEFWQANRFEAARRGCSGAVGARIGRRTILFRRGLPAKLGRLGRSKFWPIDRNFFVHLRVAQLNCRSSGIFFPDNSCWPV
jgi:hypothetical protein